MVCFCVFRAFFPAMEFPLLSNAVYGRNQMAVLEGRVLSRPLGFRGWPIESPAPKTATTERGPPKSHAVLGHDGAWPST